MGAVKKKKHAAKKKPSLGKKALAIHIAHAIAKAEKKKKADTINVISSRSDRRMAYDEVGGPATLVQHRHPNPDKAFGDDEDPAFAAEGGHGAVNDPAFTAPGSPLDTLETSKHHRDLQAEQKKKLVKNGLADRPMANKIVDSVTGHGGKIDDQWSTKKKKKKKPTKKKAPKSTLQKEKRALEEGARYQRTHKKSKEHKAASAHKGKKHSKKVKMKASKHGILKGVAKKGMKALIKKAVKKAVKKKKKKKGKKKKKAHKKAKKSTKKKKKKKGVFPPFSSVRVESTDFDEIIDEASPSPHQLSLALKRAQSKLQQEKADATMLGVKPPQLKAQLKRAGNSLLGGNQGLNRRHPGVTPKEGNAKAHQKELKAKAKKHRLKARELSTKARHKAAEARVKKQQKNAASLKRRQQKLASQLKGKTTHSAAAPTSHAAVWASAVAVVVAAALA